MYDTVFVFEVRERFHSLKQTKKNTQKVSRDSFVMKRGIVLPPQSLFLKLVLESVAWVFSAVYRNTSPSVPCISRLPVRLWNILNILLCIYSRAILILLLCPLLSVCFPPCSQTSSFAANEKPQNTFSAFALIKTSLHADRQPLLGCPSRER